MEWKEFTPEEVKELKENPYTNTVSNKTISFTKAFKEEFLKLKNEGYGLEIIARKLGYNPDILGMKRLRGINCHIQEEAVSANGIHTGTLRSKKIQDENIDDAENKDIIKLKHKVAYLEQQFNFLKKIMSVDKINSVEK